MGLMIITVITLHFIFDWILQPRVVAKNKKNDLECLMMHMLINILPFSIILWIILPYAFGYSLLHTLFIVIVNGLSHFIIDMLLPNGSTERQIINWTAVDQILHINILIVLLLFS